MPVLDATDAERQQAARDHTNDEDCLRVAGTTNVQGLATSIAQSIYEGNPPVLRAIGAGAINQAQKALAVARGIVASCGYDLYVKPGFSTFVTESGEDRTAMTFRVVVDH